MMKPNYLIIASLACMAWGSTIPSWGRTSVPTVVAQSETTVNTASLEQALSDADAILSAPTDYLPGLVNDLEDAVYEARLVLQGEPTQTQVNKCATKVKSAMSKVKASKGKTFDAGNLGAAYDADRGFIHPGGLHTQADFDRIKQQLANGNAKVTAAMKVLREATYSQASCATYPTETIVRGGSGENYINAARGATIAYQNALRWKIDGTKANADHAVKVLMDWCNTTKAISGSSDACLACGLYGYQFAQAAELMRDYEGWKAEDFAKFKQWMLEVWYPGCIGFLRGRNGTWENASKWWQAPGHYWSNWGLCNAMAVLSIGVLCDDVFIYNQGLSFIKYDQVGTFKDPRTDNPIKNDGLTEFLGNLVVTTYESDLETGAYGKLGQMNESGRDTGHAAMSAGLAVDVAHQIWNQGDDLFAYMDHRLAAGLEYIAAQTQSVQNLPWVNYHYANNGFYYSDSRSQLMTAPALGAQMRPYWGAVIGHYEGVKGVKMPFSEKAYKDMGIDYGGMGATSGGYDHLGYSVLMNTYEPQLAPADKVPTELSGYIEYNGKVIEHNELGGLKNTYQFDKNKAEKRGNTVKLMPQLPDGETDTGLWTWNTGETTRDITVTTDKSYAYRVTYTNANGVKSQQVFTIAVDADCNPAAGITGRIEYNGTAYDTDTITVFYGETVKLILRGGSGYDSYEWDNGTTSSTLTTGAIVRPRDFTGVCINQGGARSACRFHVNVKYLQHQMVVNGNVIADTCSATVNLGDNVTVGPYVPKNLPASQFSWDTGEKTATIQLDSITTSETLKLQYNVNGTTETATYTVLVNDTADVSLPEGDYLVVNRFDDTRLTNMGESVKCIMAQPVSDDDILSQVWRISNNGQGYHRLMSVKDSLYLSSALRVKSAVPNYIFAIQKAVGMDYYEVHSKASYYWGFKSDGSISLVNAKMPTTYSLLFIPYTADAIMDVVGDESGKPMEIYNLLGQKLNAPQKGINIINGKKVLVR